MLKNYLMSNIKKILTFPLIPIGIYELVKNADLHLSCYSTVALEASMLGTPTILININNMAQLHYSSISMKFDNIKICESEEEAVDLIDTISNGHNNNKPYILNNKENIKQFLKTI